MTDTMRHRKEDPKQRTLAVDSAQGVEIGDLCFLNTDDVRAASQFTWDTSLAVTQRAFSKVFVGISADRHTANDSDVTEIGIERAGIKEFECVAATFEVGDLVGPAKATGDALEDQKVVAVAGVDLAIGKVAQRYSSNTTSVLVEIFPKVTSDNLRVEDIVRELEQATTKLSADAVQDGSTNHVFTTSDDSKLAGIEASADVTDATNVAAAGAVMDSDIAAAEGFLRKTGAGTYEGIKSNLAAAVAPTANEDSGDGYVVGSIWIDTTADNAYVCVDDTVGAAVWLQYMKAAESSKLAGIEASADVTDATNVAAAGAFIIGTHNADNITDGATNHVFTAVDDTKLGNIGINKLYVENYTCIADDDTANYHDFVTGFGVAPDGWNIQIFRAGVNVMADAIVTALGDGDAGKIRVADGGATYTMTAGDVVMVMAWDKT